MKGFLVLKKSHQTDFPKPSKLKISPFLFVQQVRAEIAKVVWPSRRETGITTLIVFLIVLLTASFFLIVDQLVAFGIREILSLFL